MKRARHPAAISLASLVVFASTSTRTARAAGPDPAAEAARLVTQLDAPETRALVAEPLGKAKAAEERAKNARASGDLQHATELDVLALTWAQVASDLVRTAAAEKKLAEVQKQLGELEQKAARSQALIEQTIARRGRAEQNLATFEASKPASASKPPADKASAKKPALSRPVKAKGGDKK